VGLLWRMPNLTVLLAVDGPLATITLNRPERLNAMNMAWIESFDTAVNRLADLPDVAVVIIRGRGRAFCAGLDLDMFEASGMPTGFFEGQERALRHLELLDVVSIAAIHGYCLGGGVQVAIACDLRVCSSDATLGLPAINEGLFPGLAPFRLPRLVGPGSAARLVLSGESVGADEALRLGLVDYVVAAEDFEPELEAIVHGYLAAPRAAVIGSKRLMRQAFEAGWEQAFAMSLPLLQTCLASPDVSAARAARRERTRSQAPDTLRDS
jgi:enoyl-CoA hydratase/carnithine racemase